MPGKPGETKRVLEVARFSRLQSALCREVTIVQPFYIAFGFFRHGLDPIRTQTADGALPKIKVVLLSHKTQEGVVILERRKQVRPGLVQLRAGGVIENVLREKPVVSMILYESVKIVSLRVVVTIVVR